ncbi:hypothetical protein KU617_23195, partial [Salmonella enterica subsp. enterica serovar Montevideo]|nr:hypothetical protein [Salmonella enterica subsp. enterica serovar Montevideo]
RPEGAKQFWLWAVVWWLVLLGRSTSWGRDYFPDEPRILFRMIIRLFWFLIPNHKFYEYALISKQCDILNVFLMFLFNPCLM